VGKVLWGQNNSSPGFDRFAVQRAVRQRSISDDLIYSLVVGFFGAHYLATLGLGYFVSRQSNSPPAAIERADVVAFKKYFHYPNNRKA